MTQDYIDGVKASVDFLDKKCKEKNDEVERVKRSSYFWEREEVWDRRAELKVLVDAKVGMEKYWRKCKHELNGNTKSAVEE